MSDNKALSVYMTLSLCCVDESECCVQMNEAVNAADSLSTPLHSAAVNRSLACLQSVWEKISALRSDAFSHV